MSHPYWSVAVYSGLHDAVTSPPFSTEKEARQAFHNPGLFEAESLPESYAVVLWQTKEVGEQSAVLSKVVSMPVELHEVWSPSF